MYPPPAIPAPRGDPTARLFWRGAISSWIFSFWMLPGELRTLRRPKGSLYGATQKETAVGVSRGGVLRGVSPGSPQNVMNHYFGYQIRILRGRFTPVGFLLKAVF